MKKYLHLIPWLIIFASISSSGQNVSSRTPRFSSEIKKESNGYWLYLDGQKTPAITGIVYQPVPNGKHIRDYSKNWAELYRPLLDENRGGKGHARQLAELGVKAIRIYEVPIHDQLDAQRVKDIFRSVHSKYQIRIMVGFWAGLFSNTDFTDQSQRASIILDAIQMTEMYKSEPWLLGWQIGNENNYHVNGGALGQEIKLKLSDYYVFMDAIAGAVRERIGRTAYKQFIALGQGDLTAEEAGLIAKMRNIDVVGINSYRSPQGPLGIEQVIKLAAETIRKPILFSEFGKTAATAGEEKTQGEYLQQVSAIIFAHSAGRLGFGNVIAGFVHEATDEQWKQFERGRKDDAHFGVLGKQGLVMLRESIAAREEFHKIMPLTDAPEELMRGAWQLLGKQDYGYSMGYALKVNKLYGAEADKQQSALKAAKTDSERSIDSNWALNVVGSAYFLLGKAYYEINDKENAKSMFTTLVTRYEDAYLRDRDGTAWQLSKVVRKLFPDLFEPYFQVNTRNTFIFSGFFLSLVFLRKRSRKGTKLIENVAALSFRHRVEFVLLVAIQMVLIFYFVGWWFHPIRLEFHIVSPLLFWILSFIGIIDIVFFFYLWHLLWSMERPKYIPPESGKRVAMVTTFVPTEPIDMVEGTLLSMRNVSYPHDVFVLDEADESRMKDICERLGVTHFSRKGVDRYNQSSGRFQTKTKGGNLNAWLDSHGNKYEFVTFLDPDHKPNANYLDRVLGYFKDDSVAFVQAPQIYGNQSDNWIARGAAEQSYSFYGPILMGLYGRGNCIANGSHSTFRIKAFQDTNGYAVHDADDVLMSLRLLAKGWQGVFIPEVLAVGLAPDNWSAFLNQQFRWSYSMFDLLFHHFSREFVGLNFSRRLGYFVISIYYFLAVFFVLLLIMPIASILMNNAPANTELLSFCKYFIPVLIARYFLLLAWGQRFLIQPERERGIWYRGGFLWIATWPYYFLAFLKAIPKNSVRPRITTPKGKSGQQSYFVMFRPHIVLMSLTALAAAYTFAFNSYIWPTQGMRTFLLISFVCQLCLTMTCLKRDRKTTMVVSEAAPND